MHFSGLIFNINQQRANVITIKLLHNTPESSISFRHFCLRRATCGNYLCFRIGGNFSCTVILCKCFLYVGTQQLCQKSKWRDPVQSDGPEGLTTRKVLLGFHGGVGPFQRSKSLSLTAMHQHWRADFCIAAHYS